MAGFADACRMRRGVRRFSVRQRRGTPQSDAGVARRASVRGLLCVFGRRSYPDKTINHANVQEATMQARFARGIAQTPLTVTAREYPLAEEAAMPEVGDLVSVYSQDQETEFSVRLNAVAGPDLWYGVIFAISRGAEMLVVAEGLELDDVVSVRRQEIASVIKADHPH